jgi:uncharacterized protein (DUF305 family)
MVSVSPTFRAVLGLAAVAAATACAPAAQTADEVAPQPSVDVAAYEALYRARRDSAMMQYSEADVHFVTGMIAHHAQALIMSALAPTNEAGPVIRTLTARIINAQKDEIALMQQWLRDRGEDVPVLEGEGVDVVVLGHEHMHMAGMLTPDQLADLEAATGSEFDRLFLTYMIQHHEGAVTMVHELFATDGAGIDGAIFKLASDIQADQTSEITRMRSMLESMN